MALELSENGNPPAAVVLEAPVSEASGICSHWLGGMFFPSLLGILKELCSKVSNSQLSPAGQHILNAVIQRLGYYDSVAVH